MTKPACGNEVNLCATECQGVLAFGFFVICNRLCAHIDIGSSYRNSFDFFAVNPISGKELAMPVNRMKIFFVILLAVAVQTGYALEKKSADVRRLTESLQQIVKNIIEGKNIDQSKSAVDLEAYMIDGKNFEPLSDAVRGISTHCRLIEGAGSKMIYQHLVIADDTTSAFMVMKTVSPEFGERFHSIVFFRESNDSWKIKSWHTSN